MAIEKMALIHIEGALKRVNKTLVKCCESNCFHMINSSHGTTDNTYKTGGFRSLKAKSPFSPVVNRATALANGLGVEIKHVDYDDVDMTVSVDFIKYLDEIEADYNGIFTEKQRLTESLSNHSVALMQLEHLAGLDVDFAELYACKYVKIRFGKLPIDSVPKLNYYSDRNFVYYRFNSDSDYEWLLYLVPNEEAVEIDDIFSSLFFERVRLPDYFHGNADEAKSAVLKLVREEAAQLTEVEARMTELRDRVQTRFLKVFNKLKALDQSYELRQNVSAVNNKFYMSGFVPKRELERFRADLSEIPDIEITEKPVDSELNVTPPVKLRNCWLFRPFEMFVKMYGLPNYNGFDPTPYVATTFMLIFGIMFGDLGQGILITIFGIILDRWRKVKLASIMQRIGIVSAVFGTLYGSVFGNEEIIEPFFKIPSVYQALGYAKAPENIFQISTILLLAAIAIGVVLVLISMAMNIVTRLRNHDYANALLDPNGVSGAVFYTSLMVAAALQLGLGIEMFTVPYILCLIVLPLALLFFKEPIVNFFSKRFKGKTKNKNIALVHAVKSYSDAVSELGSVNGTDESLEELINVQFVKSQYGLLPIECFAKLDEYAENNFVFYPFENDGEYVRGVYLCPVHDFAVVERMFEGFGFKKLKMPEHISDIRKEQALHLSADAHTEKHEKKSVGTFIIEGIIELFESCLTYVTNTMSFLRIGGFILSHAGMMLVFSVLADKFGGGVGSIIVLVIGNIFVIGMEGFLVGIQVLRLEFYEIFSRFYKGNGRPFSPAVVDFTLEQ